MLKNCLSHLFAAALIFASFAHTPAQRQLADASGADPFRIEPGSSFTASGGTPRPPRTAAAKHPITVDIEEALSIIDKNYAGPGREQGLLAASAIDGMLATLDPHSSYFSEDEYQELLDDQRSEYYGIGATIANYGTGGSLDTYVIAVQAGSPAGSAGLRYGDRILSVDGENVSGKSSDVVKDRIRGRSGTLVAVKAERPDGSTFEARLRRARVPQPTVADSYIVRPGVGYIDLTAGFSYTTGREVEEAINLLRRGGADSFILDLRGNPGGILQQAVKVVERFIPAGKVVVSQRGRSDFDNRVWRSANARPIDSPVVILVDGESASASEVVAGALQDYDRAMIVGEKTFGKGLVQSVIDLPGNSGLALTTARYYTPSGRSLQRSYAGSGFYDYYNQRAGTGEPPKEAETSGHRKVLGGDGITPDEVIAGERITNSRRVLLDPIFFYVRDAAGGKFSSTAAGRPVGGGLFVETSMSKGDAALLASFTEHLRRENADLSGITAESDFLIRRLRFEATLSAQGQSAANRYLIQTDPQVKRALEVIPRAAELARSSRTTFRAANKK